MTRLPDFSLAALYAALDAQRQARGLTWAEATRQISRLSERTIASSTITGLRTRAVAEADGVLQMLLWLKRSPESFVPGHPDAGTELPAVTPPDVLRFDTRSLHAALNAQRLDRKMTWAQVAQEIGVAASQLAHLASGGRTGFPGVMRIVRWLGRPAAHFTSTQSTAAAQIGTAGSGHPPASAAVDP